MTTFQYWMIGLTCVGILITAGGVIGACVWAVAKIKSDVTEKIAEERARTDTVMEAERENTNRLHQELMVKFAAEQKAQDHNTGEMGAALRQHITTVEKKIHEVEIWGRDHFALKNDVADSIKGLRDDVRVMGSDLRGDIKEISAKIDKKAA
ncbi:MAG: hypothetical protein G4V63_07515 [Candidatus Afipia apatlaquensis]|uniref:Uncharacterized protein n=1 Tax=Candidatus Afipia apatlaquensis TaxID=2712852 RepID=A0A7C9VG93_9BRAD|nr:hypothetical protein [Candidatus Afipia apatlaquensis]